MEVKLKQYTINLWREWVVLLLALPLLLFFNFWNLENYPVTSGWDEGIYLQFSHNLAYHGIYGSSDGNYFHVLIPAGGSGPVVIMLIAMTFKFFGQSLFNARLVIACFLFLATVSIYILIRWTSRWEAALAGVFLFLVAGYGTYNSFWLGRQVLFEIPSLVFIFLGYLFLFKTIEQTRMANLFTSMVMFGLAVVTKNQLLFILAPSLGIMLFLDILYYRQNRWWIFAATLLSVIVFYFLWYTITLVLVDSERSFYLEAQSALFKATYLHINLSRIWTMIKLFIKSGYFLPIPIAWIFVVPSALKKNSLSLVRASLLSLAFVGLSGALIFSLPWPRYLYTGIVLTIPVVALFLADTMKYLQKNASIVKRYFTLTFYLGLALFSFTKLYFESRLILRTQDYSAKEFAQVVDRIVPDNEYILNWEWEVEFYSQRTFIHPDFRLFPAILDQGYNYVYSPILNEPRIPQGIQYVIVGPFASDTWVFASELEQRQAVIIHKVGNYSLYFVP